MKKAQFVVSVATLLSRFGFPCDASADKTPQCRIAVVDDLGKPITHYDLYLYHCKGAGSRFSRAHFFPDQPNSEFIVPGNPDAAPAVPPKIKKRPHLIRVVSEQTMRTNSSVRISTFDISPGSPPSTGSILTPGTTTSSLYTDFPSAKNLIVHDRIGAVAPEDPPEDPYLRPYWLMRALALSMKNQKGAYINSRLFIPQSVWVFKGVKLKATEEKVSCFHSMTLAVRQVLDTDYRNFSLLVQVSPIAKLSLFVGSCES